MLIRPGTTPQPATTRVSLDDLQDPMDREVISLLPFSPEDYGAVNATFQQWRLTRRQRDRDVLLTWVLAYARAYFTVKWLTCPEIPVTDIEKAISDAFRRAFDSMDDVRQTDSFASYVSVICRNTFVNLTRHLKVVRKEPATLALIDRIAPVDLEAEVDRSTMIDTLVRAIGRLPEANAAMVEMRFGEGLEYDEIARRTGYKRGAVRKHIYRALLLLRSDPEVRELVRALRKNEPQE